MGHFGMNKQITAILILVIIMLGASASAVQAESRNQAKLGPDFKPGQLLFEANGGQAPPDVRYLSRARGFNLYLTDTGASLQLQKRSGADPVVVNLRFTGSDGPAKVSAEDPRPAKINYFYGADPQRWLRGLTTYGRVRLQQTAADIVLYGNEDELEYDLVLPAGADPASVRLKIEGAEDLRLDANGDLVLVTAGGDLVMRRPVTYQERKGKRIPVSSEYVVMSSTEVGFNVGKYDRNKPLTIDPVLIFSTYLGGSQPDFGTALTLDSAGNAFVTGRTMSTNFPTLGGFSNANRGGTDVFVAKLSPSGQLLYSTYFGGSGDDSGTGIKVTAAGTAFISGISDSSDLPRQLSTSSFSGTFQGFVASFNFVGDLGFSMFVADMLEANSIALDSSGNIHLAGKARAVGGANTDAVVVKLTSTGNVLFRTQIGGTGDESSASVVVDGAGTVFTAGMTNSSNLPLRSPFQPGLAGGSDCFIATLGSNGGLQYLSYLGGINDDFCMDITVDSTGMYVTGVTRSPNFPTSRPAQGTLRGNQDIFLTKLNPGGGSLVYSTFFGGGAGEIPGGIAVDSIGAVIAFGQTTSTDLPVVNAYQTTSGGLSDAFTVKLDPTGALVASSYFGGSLDDYGTEIEIDGSGNAYLVGSTSSADFPTAAALQGTRGGGFDVFVTRIPEGEFRPRNDDFVNATVISGPSGSVTGGNVGATFEAKEPSLSRAGRTSVWWRWTAPFTSTATFDTVGSEFDTVLGIFRGADLGNLTTVAEDDDGGGNGTSLASFAATQGVTYYISVNGFNSAAGRIVLRWAIKPPPISGTVNIQGFGGNINAGQQAAAQVVLSNPYPLPMSGQLTMSFLPAAGLPAADPQMQFLTGGTTVGFTIPANSNQALFADGSGGISFQSGTVAGTITFTVSLQSSNETITPSPAPRATATVNSQSPVITNVTINSVSGNVLEVIITGYSSIREVTEANFTFAAATGITVNTPNVKVNVNSVFTQWYQGATSQNFGSQFKLTVPFTLQGGTRSGLSGVTVNLVNRIGTSNNVNQPF